MFDSRYRFGVSAIEYVRKKLAVLKYILTRSDSHKCLVTTNDLTDIGSKRIFLKLLVL